MVTRTQSNITFSTPLTSERVVFLINGNCASIPFCQINWTHPISELGRVSEACVSHALLSNREGHSLTSHPSLPISPMIIALSCRSMGTLSDWLTHAGDKSGYAKYTIRNAFPMLSGATWHYDDIGRCQALLFCFSHTHHLTLVSTHRQNQILHYFLFLAY